MANSYKTPGVYVEEIPKLPQSVADVPTAIPGFVGYTEFASSNSDREVANLLNAPTKIGSLLEFERYFGKAPKLETWSNGDFDHKFVLYDSIRLFYDNGGGVCYIVSIGDYSNAAFTPESFKDGLKKLEDIDEVTLLLMPDAATCLNEAGLAAVQQTALMQCQDLKDRFAILDVKEDKSQDAEKVIQKFRDGIGMQGLEYGAAYYPYIATSYTYSGFAFSSIVGYIMEQKYKKADNTYETDKIFAAFKNDTSSCLAFLRAWGNHEEGKKYLGTKTNDELKMFYSSDNICCKLAGKLWENLKGIGLQVTNAEANKKVEAKYGELTKEGFNAELKAYIESELNPSETFDGLDEAVKKEKADLFLKKKVLEDLISAEIEKTGSDYLTKYLFEINPTDKDQQAKENALKPFVPYYEEYEKDFADMASIVPPSGAIAGIYAQNDNFSGVWKAPANMSIASIRGVSRLINNQLQDGMNVHSTGKSVNAIRAFSGKGILVWGARTLKGNDNEWRYIPVRRLFNYVEESVQESTEWAVFAPNTQNTWTKIKCQIENFLTNIWRAGGLAGATPEQAFYVNCGLNVTMDAQDILEGRLIVEIGMAAVRPAEFIILRFSHKLQES